MVNLEAIVRIATLNLCLGLKFKKDLVKDLLLTNDIDILLMQEIEIERDFNCELMNIPGYIFESEKNDYKKRVGMYIKNSIKYVRCMDLEDENAHLMVIDVENRKKNKKRVINIYRSFNPNGETAKELFTRQLFLINAAFNDDTVIMGDFNLDFARRHDVSYERKNYFELFEEKLGDLNLIQMVKFVTWSRLIGLVLRSSILDHIYVNGVTLIKNVTHNKPCFGDHELVMAQICIDKPKLKTITRRNWRNYSKNELCLKLSGVDWSNNANCVQEMWNDFENKLIEVVDLLAPLSKFKGEFIVTKPCPVIKNKLNLRNRLLKIQKQRPTLDLKKRIKNLNVEIKNHFRFEKRNNVRRKIVPGNSKSLWSAVNAAHDNGSSTLPDCMTLEGRAVCEHERSDCFANFFENKVKQITEETLIDPGVYNGIRKIFASNEMFMSVMEVEKCIKSIKIKNCEGFDRIPQRVLVDGIDHLLPPLGRLFGLIYYHKSIPEQWRLSKIIPVHKKGSKQKIENYRPVANLCSASKIFERLILNRINKLELLGGVDLTNSCQHGFKKNKGTASAGLLLQSMISRALDEDEFVAMASLDLSSAFDVVDVPLLIRRLGVLGLPDDVID